MLRPGRPGVLRHPAIVHGLPHLLLPHLQCRPRHAGAARRLQEGARVARQRDRADQAGRVDRQGLRACGRRRRSSASPTRCRRSACSSATASACALHERPIISRVVSLDHPTEIKEGMVFALETYCPAKDGYLRRAHRGGGRGHRQGLPRHHAVPGRGTADRQPVLRRLPSSSLRSTPRPRAGAFISRAPTGRRQG